MSGYKEHRKFGLICLIILTIALLILEYIYSLDFIYIDIFSLFILKGIGIPLIIIAFLIGIYASLMPDIDVGTSKAFQFTVTILLLICILFILLDSYKLQTVVILLIVISMLFLNHRGLTHSKWFGLLIAIIFGFAFGSMMVSIYTLVGYYSHLYRDWRD